MTNKSEFEPGDRVTALKSIPNIAGGYCIEAGQVYKVQSLDENGDLVFREINASLPPNIFEPAPPPREPQWKAGDRILLPVTLTSDRFEDGTATIQFEGSGSRNFWFKEDLDVAIPAPIDDEVLDYRKIRNDFALKVQESGVSGLTKYVHPDVLPELLANAWLVLSDPRDRKGNIDDIVNDKFLTIDWAKDARRSLRGYAETHERPKSWPWNDSAFDIFKWLEAPTNDFYEKDETLEEIRAAYEQGTKGITVDPDSFKSVTIKNNSFNLARIRVDFNSLLENGKLHALSERADAPLTQGQIVEAYDADGNRVTATVLAFGSNDLVILEPDMATWIDGPSETPKETLFEYPPATGHR